MEIKAEAEWKPNDLRVIVRILPLGRSHHRNSTSFNGTHATERERSA